MKKIRISALLLFLSLLACAQAVTTVGVAGPDSIPQAVYTMYLYVAPSTPQLKAVFLKNPDAGVEVVPYSVQITTMTGTAGDALAFVENGAGYKRTSFQRVEFRGKTIGYLLVPERHSFARRYIEINFYERDGKIYFAPSELGSND
jgi:hypothetical protein